MVLTHRQHGRERGSILTVGMLALTLMTLVGIAASTNSGIESEIAKNEKSYQQALYSAEIAMVEGERVLEDLAARADLNEGTTPGRYGPKSLRFDRTTYQMQRVIGQTGQPLKWDSSDTAVVQNIPSLITNAWKSDPPRYTIEDRGLKGDSLGQGTTYGQSGAALFAVTARGTGGGNVSHVLMEAVYAKRF